MEFLVALATLGLCLSLPPSLRLSVTPVSLFSLVNANTNTNRNTITNTNTKNNTNTNTNSNTNTNIITNTNTNTFLLDYLSVKCKFNSKIQFLIQTSATMKGYCLLVFTRYSATPVVGVLFHCLNL